MYTYFSNIAINGRRHPTRALGLEYRRPTNRSQEQSKIPVRSYTKALRLSWELILCIQFHSSGLSRSFWQSLFHLLKSHDHGCHKWKFQEANSGRFTPARASCRQEHDHRLPRRVRWSHSAHCPQCWPRVLVYDWGGYHDEVRTPNGPSLSEANQLTFQTGRDHDRHNLFSFYEIP